MSRLFYAGIGSRQTPRNILELMTNAAGFLEDEGFILRSGGAPGADQAFFDGLKNERLSQIFIPWEGFNGFSGRDPEVYRFDALLEANRKQAMAIAQRHHPAWDRLSSSMRRLMARNILQVLGPDLTTPSAFVLCWTSGGQGAGGTGQAIRVARDNLIPVIDLGRTSEEEASNRILEIIEERTPA